MLDKLMDVVLHGRPTVGKQASRPAQTDGFTMSANSKREVSAQLLAVHHVAVLPGQQVGRIGVGRQGRSYAPARWPSHSAW